LTETDGSGRVTWVQSEALIFTRKVEDAVATYADGHGRPTRKVSCAGGSVLTRKPGEKITCRLVYADGATGTAVVGVKDLNSNVALLSVTP
jgi:hypothetical protein